MENMSHFGRKLLGLAISAFLISACEAEVVSRQDSQNASQGSGSGNKGVVGLLKGLGETCTYSSDCDSGHCFAYAATASICSTTCTTDSECVAKFSSGYVCKPSVSSEDKLCAPGTRGSSTTNESDTTTGNTEDTGTTGTTTSSAQKSVGQTCSASSECLSGYCFRYSSTASPICSQKCTTDCSAVGSNYQCLATSVSGLSLCAPGSGSSSTGSTTPEPGEFGSSCSAACDCNSNLCVRVSGMSPFCTQLCNSNADCPSNSCISVSGTSFCMI